MLELRVIIAFVVMIASFFNIMPIVIIGSIGVMLISIKILIDNESKT